MLIHMILNFCITISEYGLVRAYPDISLSTEY
jgi:hypothetical protein